MSIVAKIKADPDLLTWARASIRYNTGREMQALDFMHKMKWRNRWIDGATLNNVKAALRQIEREDREQ